VPFNRDVELGHFADFISEKQPQTHSVDLTHKKAVSDDFEDIINSKLGLFHGSTSEQFQTVNKSKGQKETVNKTYKKSNQQIPKNIREDVVKRMIKEKEMAEMQGREVSSNIDKILSS